MLFFQRNWSLLFFIPCSSSFSDTLVRTLEIGKIISKSHLWCRDFLLWRFFPVCLSHSASSFDTRKIQQFESWNVINTKHSWINNCLQAIPQYIAYPWKLSSLLRFIWKVFLFKSFSIFYVFPLSLSINVEKVYQRLVWCRSKSWAKLCWR